MENKINIAELLKDCPKGMELDCTLYENVEFDYIDESPESAYPIQCLMKTNGGYNVLVFTHNGCNDRHPNAKCVIFPKGKTTWEGFVPPIKFKDGDIVFSGVNLISILKEIKPTENFHCYVSTDMYGKLYIDEGGWTTQNIRLATEEEKAKLFRAIKDNGYKWNNETKVLEKLTEPKFKVGNGIKNKINHIATIIKFKDDYYYYKDKNGYGMFHISGQDQWELVSDKFDINTLKPFDKVLVRCGTLGKWRIQLFEKYDKTCEFSFICLGSVKYKQCIPYEGNEHLLDTTYDCADFYKTW